MHGIKETSSTFRFLWLVIHTIFLYIAYLICFDDKLIWISDILGIDFIAGNIYRKICLLSFGVIMYVRMNLTIFYLLNRKIPIDELFGIITACAPSHPGGKSIMAITIW